jgi:AraC-like DNA-binding protein
MKIYIKYMVSIRCKMIVKSELEKLGLQYEMLNLGEVKIKENITAEQHEMLKIGLMKSGLELHDEKKTILIDKIKNTVVELIHYSDRVPKTNFSDYISERLHYDYTYLGNVFSEVTGTTIEHFVITNKIERAKELLLYDKLSLTEISNMLNYSSVSHLSNQFKKVTGMTTSFFKHINQRRRINLENV